MNKKHIAFKLIWLQVILFVWPSIGWIDPLADKVREGNLLYKDGKYDEAMDKYVNAQINFTDMPQLDFNIADTQYKRGKYKEAAQLFEKVTKSEDPAMRAKALFNTGNTLYRQGKMNEALAYYKKTVDCIDDTETGSEELESLKNDAKYNYEYVEKKLEEQKQEQQDTNQKDQQQKDDDNNKNEQSGKDKGDEKPENDKKQSGSENNQEKNESKEGQNDQSEKDKPKDQPSEQQPRPQPQSRDQMSEEEAERLLNALNQSEKEARIIKRDTQHLQHKSVEKDW